MQPMIRPWLVMERLFLFGHHQKRFQRPFCVDLENDMMLIHGSADRKRGIVLMYLIEILDLKEAWVTSFYDIFLCKIKNEDDQNLEK